LSGQNSASGFRPLRLLTILAALALVGVTAFLLNRYISPEAILSRYDRIRFEVDNHPIRATVVYMAAYAGVVSLSLPGSAMMTVLGGLLFGWLWGGLAAMGAATGGAIIIFSIARTTLGVWLARVAGPGLAKAADGIRQDAANYMLFMRLVPLFPFFLVNLAPALVGVKLRTFAWTTALGIIPATTTLAIVGAGLDSVVRRQKAAYEACVTAAEAVCRFDLSLKSLISPGMLVAFAALGFIALVPVIVRRTGLLGSAARR
jgi:uncharacterized membrane protein YdjX (TVP38/TMEM64 family)